MVTRHWQLRVMALMSVVHSLNTPSTETDTGSRGYGITFTLGEGTNVVLEAIKLLEKRLVGRSLEKIFNNYRAFYRSLIISN